MFAVFAVNHLVRARHAALCCAETGAHVRSRGFREGQMKLTCEGHAACLLHFYVSPESLEVVNVVRKSGTVFVTSN